MPKQISIDQTAKLYNIMGGNIPLAAVRQDVRGWEGFERRVLTRAAEMSVQDWQKDYRKKLADDYMARAKYDSSRGFISEALDRSGGAGVIDELRQKKIDREAVATSIFHRAVREGDVDTAYAMIDTYGDLRKLVPHVGNYGVRKALAERLLSDMGLKWLIEAIRAEGMSTLGVQCVAFIADVLNNYVGEKIVTKGSTGHGKEMLSKISSSKYGDKLTDVTASAAKDSFRSLQFGDLVQLPGNFGHVMMFVGYNQSGEPIFMEAVGELQDSPYARWKGYSEGAYKYFDETDAYGKHYTAKGLKPHLQTYGKNYLTNRNAGAPTKILRMNDTKKLPKDMEETYRLLQLIMPSGDENGGID